MARDKIATQLPGKCPHRIFALSCGRDPDLLVLAGLGKDKENHQKRKDLFLIPKPQNSWERRENHQKKQGIPCKRKSKEIQKSKAKKIRGGDLRDILS